MGDADAEPHQPCGEHGVRLVAGVAPRRAVVHQHRLGQPVAPEDGAQPVLHGGGALVGAGGEAERVARMVVEHGQWMAAPGRGREMALEVHLPQLVRTVALEPAPRRVAGRRGRVQLVVAAQDLGDGTGARHRSMTEVVEPAPDLAPAPRLIACGAHREHRRLDRRRDTRRARPRTSRAVGQTIPPFRRVPPEPLVAGLSADPEATAQLAPVRPIAHRQTHELLSQFHHRSLPPDHDPILLQPAKDWKSVNHVSEHLSPMSPVCTPPKRGKRVTC